jgi:hypothetical protein
MENESRSTKEPLTSEEARAKAAILAGCENLAAAGVTFVAIHFDGCGDSGVTEEAQCFDSDYYAYEKHDPVTHDVACLQEHFETLVPLGYENDCGGFGEVVLDVGSRRITVERNDRFEDYITSTYEATAQDWLSEIRPQRWMYGQRLEQHAIRLQG